MNAHQRRKLDRATVRRLGGIGGRIVNPDPFVLRDSWRGTLVSVKDGRVLMQRDPYSSEVRHGVFEVREGDTYEACFMSFLPEAEFDRVVAELS